jgi:hypothetical protein
VQGVKTRTHLRSWKASHVDIVDSSALTYTKWAGREQRKIPRSTIIPISILADIKEFKHIFLTLQQPECQFEGQGCDSVLPDQGYPTFQTAVIDI